MSDATPGPYGFPRTDRVMLTVMVVFLVAAPVVGGAYLLAVSRLGPVSDAAMLAGLFVVLIATAVVSVHAARRGA